MTRVYDRPATIDEAYARCHHLIKYSVRGFLKRHGGDPEETLARANLSFLEAYYDHHPERGTFGKRVCFLAWCYMMDGYRADLNYQNRYPKSEAEPRHLSSRPPGFDLERFTSELSEDAQQALQVALDLPGKGRGRSWQQTLVEALSAQGWTGARIVESIQEIREALVA